MPGFGFSGLHVTVIPPKDWTPERRKQFGVDTAQRYCAFFRHQASSGDLGGPSLARRRANLHRRMRDRQRTQRAWVRLSMRNEKQRIHPNDQARDRCSSLQQSAASPLRRRCLWRSRPGPAARARMDTRPAARSARRAKAPRTPAEAVERHMSVRVAVVGKFLLYDQGAKNDDVSDGKVIYPKRRVALAAWGEQRRAHHHRD